MITIVRLETKINGFEFTISGRIQGHLVQCSQWVHKLGSFLFPTSRWRIDSFIYYSPLKSERADQGYVEFRIVRFLPR